MALKDNASLALIPVAYKEDKLYSVIPNDNDGDFDYSGGTNGTRVNSAGLIETVAADIPRLDYPLLDGVVQSCPTLLLEPQRTNVISYSEDFSNSYWDKFSITITSNQDISPNGSLDANLIQEQVMTNSQSRYFKTFYGITSGIDYSFSMFFKLDNNSRQLYIGLTGAGSLGRIYINNDLTYFTKENPLNIKIEKLKNGWCKVSLTVTSNSSSLTTFIGFAKNNGETYTSNGSAEMYLWGAQLEQGSYATSYIKTQGETNGVTRSADICTGAGTAADFNDSVGVLYFNGSVQSKNVFLDNFKISLGDDVIISNDVQFDFTTSTVAANKVQGSVIIDGLLASRTNTAFNFNINVNDFNKVAYQYKDSDYKMYVNGFKAGSSTYNNIFSSGSLQEVNFRQSGSGDNFEGNTKELMTFNQSMTDAEMETLTSYKSFKEMAKELLFTIE